MTAAGAPAAAAASGCGDGGAGGGGDTFAGVNDEPAGWMSRKRRDSPCAGSGGQAGGGQAATDGMDVEVEGGAGVGGNEAGHGGGEAGRGSINITSFSPYAARLGVDSSPVDDVGR